MLSGSLLYGDNGADSVAGEDDDLFAYNFGAHISYAGFALGGAFSRGRDGGGGTSGTDGVPAQRANSRAWTVGANYSFGSYVIGATYMKGEENPTNNAGKGRLDQANISGTYQVGPGISLVGGWSYEIAGFRFYGMPKSCTSGSVQLNMWANCDIMSVRTRGGCEVAGVP